MTDSPGLDLISEPGEPVQIRLSNTLDSVQLASHPDALKALTEAKLLVHKLADELEEMYLYESVSR